MRVTIGKNESYSTKVVENTPYYIVGEVFTSLNKIEKNTTQITIESFDANDGEKDFEYGQRGQQIIETAEKLIQNPYHCREWKSEKLENCMEVVALWQDEIKPGEKRDN